MQTLADRIGLISEADRRYFERLPHRRHRIRVAGRVEIEEAKLLKTEQHRIAVWKLTPRLLITGPPDADVESFPEWRAS
jgi:hypothetical protein